jgi:selenide,water dikinase
MPEELKLTALSSCAGCAAKLPQAALAELMARLPPAPRDPKLLVGAATADDAGVYRIGRDLALVQTVDFFTPIVDDPFTYGQIAATNAISDVFAMGGRPITALNLLGIPPDVVPPEVVAEILRGGLEKASEARCTILGGHTIRLPEPIYGMAVTGVVAPKNILSNTFARPGDWLVLTKPLGTGIITTAIKRGIASAAVRKQAMRSMTMLNSAGAVLAERRLVRAATDVTGFGLFGHLANICRGSQVAAEIDPELVPAISDEVFKLIQQDCIPGGSRQNLATANHITDWVDASRSEKHLLTDAQTSGGLLLCVAPRNLDSVLKLLLRLETPCAAVIGRIVRAKSPAIRIVRGAFTR